MNFVVRVSVVAIPVILGLSSAAVSFQPQQRNDVVRLNLSASWVLLSARVTRSR
jgi:hypothetical protein